VRMAEEDFHSIDSEWNVRVSYYLSVP
jgi:hypothetical protein